MKQFVRGALDCIFLDFLHIGPHDSPMKKLLARTVRKIVSTRALSVPGKRLVGTLLNIISYALSTKRGMLVFYYFPHDPDAGRIINFIRDTKEQRQVLLDDHEAYHIYRAVQKTAKIPGDIAEVGVYKGGSATLICEAKGDRPLHLFDTFAGLPSVDPAVDGALYKGQLVAPMDGVLELASHYKNVHIYKGIFPETGHAVSDRKFSFIHLDVDTYESTLNCLRFFHPRMSPGGILISHNYADALGVRKALDEFYADKIDPIIELPCTQCLVVKV